LKNGFKVVSKFSLPGSFPFFYEDDLFMLKTLTGDEEKQPDAEVRRQG